jgi:hypothetical protein
MAPLTFFHVSPGTPAYQDLLNFCRHKFTNYEGLLKESGGRFDRTPGTYEIIRDRCDGGDTVLVLLQVQALPARAPRPTGTPSGPGCRRRRRGRPGRRRRR